MFRISFLVEDKRLPEVLHGLAGKVVEMEPPVPVQGYGSNDVPAPKQRLTPALPSRDFVPGPKPKGHGAKQPIEGIRQYIKKDDLLDSGAIADAIEKLGWARGSFSYAIKKAVKAKILRRVGVGQYEVI